MTQGTDKRVFWAGEKAGPSDLCGHVCGISHDDRLYDRLRTTARRKNFVVMPGGGMEYCEEPGVESVVTHVCCMTSTGGITIEENLRMGTYPGAAGTERGDMAPPSPTGPCRPA